MIWMDFEFYVTVRLEFLPEFYCNHDCQAMGPSICLLLTSFCSFTCKLDCMGKCFESFLSLNQKRTKGPCLTFHSTSLCFFRRLLGIRELTTLNQVTQLSSAIVVLLILGEFSSYQ